MKSVPKMQPTAAANDIGWRAFPEYELLLGSEDQASLLAKVEKTCQQLNAVVQSGSEQDKQRAQLAMTAYGRSLDLLHLLKELKERQVAQQE